MAEPTPFDLHPSVAPQETEGSEGFKLMRNRELHDFSQMKVTATEEQTWGTFPSKVEVTKPDGTAMEVDAGTVLYKFVKDGKELTVTVSAAEHIDNLHIKGSDPGSVFDYPTIDALMVDMAKKIPSEVASTPGTSALAVDMGKHMGNEGIASLAELKSENILTEDDSATADSVRAEVMNLNKTGDPEAKGAFVSKFKADHPDCKVQFQVVRNKKKDNVEIPNTGSVVPVVDTPKRPTKELFMVFGATDTGKTLWTAAPGRYMPPHPDSAQQEESFRQSSEAWFDTAMLSGK